MKALLKLKRLKEARTKIPTSTKQKYRKIFPLAGYIFLGFTFLVDYPGVLIPLKLFNAEWEFQAISKIVNTVWAPFFGFSLLFFTRENSIKVLEKKLLGLLSWLALLLGITFLCFIPLIIADASRIDLNLQKQLTQIINVQQNRTQQIQERFQAASPQELENFFKLQGENNKTANLSIKEKTYAYLQQIKAQQEASLSATKSQFLQRQNKIKRDSIFLSIGAFLGSLLLINVWRYAKWTRVKTITQ